MKAGWTISAVPPGLALAWGLVPFVTKPLNATPPEFITTDIISDADFSQITQGIRSAPKAEAPRPLVEKVAEAKPGGEEGGRENAGEGETHKGGKNQPRVVPAGEPGPPANPPGAEKSRAEAAG